MGPKFASPLRHHRTSMSPSNMDLAAKEVLANKLRHPGHTTAAAPPAPPPSAGPTDPFEGAIEPVLITEPVGDERPRKRIVTARHLEHFQHTALFGEILGFIRACNQAVKGHTLTESEDVSPVIQSLLDVLDRVRTLVDETPRDTDSASVSRFGNPAFRTLYTKICDATDTLLQRIPGLEGDSHRAARQQLSVYFYEAWGNAKRIDYGSGMELNFLCWMLGLVKLGVLDLAKDARTLVLRVFWRYIEIMRVIQATYWLEPAGSHGVWGLDDYHFLPFLWGAGQLVDHPFLRPKSIHDSEMVDECSTKYMYFACIQAINAVKTESLRWHSPMLDDISSVRTWAKVNQGMVKMYLAEVLLKLPIAQHIFFGSLLSFGDMDDDDVAGVEEDEHGHRFEAGATPHKHGHGEGQAAGWGDCCGIPIPSVFAALEKEREAGHRPATEWPVRRIPFD